MGLDMLRREAACRRSNAGTARQVRRLQTSYGTYNVQIHIDYSHYANKTKLKTFDVQYEFILHMLNSKQMNLSVESTDSQLCIYSTLNCTSQNKFDVFCVLYQHYISALSNDSVICLQSYCRSTLEMLTVLYHICILSASV